MEGARCVFGLKETEQAAPGERGGRGEHSNSGTWNFCTTFFTVFLYLHISAQRHTHALPFRVSHRGRRTTRLRSVIQRRHRREQLLLTDWYMYTHTEL
ncbi:hypothetical protein F7725_005754 [Dissostichus mawsoni]|uniref:Uncharacterized protein n=1 Tax=Dissostichus mawsoni TaxID=36200 RepID=A0A7J5YUL3_DISMA|nr:hypothetical protein F7725_005754 [Dissostichus mawsoni]